MEHPPVNARNESKELWMLESIMKDGLQIVPNAIRLSSENPDRHPSPLSYYIKAYNLRNALSHSEKQYDIYDVSNYLTITFCTYFYICKQFKDEIIQSWNLQQINNIISVEKYCRNILEDYKGEKNNFIDLRWEFSNDEQLLTAPQLALKSCCKIKLNAIAGSGKTFALHNIEYQLARRCLKFVSQGKNERLLIPIYIKLADITSTSADGLAEAFSKKTGIDKSLYYDVIGTNLFAFLLDGYDEMRNIHAKRALSRHIDELISKFPKITIFVADRYSSLTNITLSRAFVDVKAHKLNSDDIKEFIEKYAEDDTRQLIIDEYNRDPNLFGELITPMHICHFIETVNFNKKIPNDPVLEYIETILQRERDEKKNDIAEPIKLFMAYLAFIDAGPRKKLVIEKSINDIKDLLGYTNTDTREVTRTAIELGILSVVDEENNYDFSTEEYKKAFEFIAYNEGIIDII